MEPRNPYMPPDSQLSAPPLRTAGGSTDVSPAALEYLRGTKPWVRLLSVLGFILSAFLVLGGLFMMVGGSFMSEELGGFPGAGIVLGGVYMLVAFLYIYPSLCLWRYGTAIQTLLSTRRPADLDEALRQQKSFWRFAGIIALVILLLYAVALVVVIIAAAVGASGALGGG